MEEIKEGNVLKLIVKKSVLESIENGLDELYFETTDFYKSRFTTSKHNTVEDLKSNPGLIKSFDEVCFSANATYVYRNVVSLELTDEENPRFLLKMEGKIVTPEEDTKKTSDLIRAYFDDVIETDREVKEYTKEDGVPVNIDEKLTDAIFDELRKRDNVYIVDGDYLHIGFEGMVFKCDKHLPLMNEHRYDFKFDVIELDLDDNLRNKIDNLVRKDYVFVSSTRTKVVDNKFIFVYYILEKIRTFNLM